MKKMIALCFVQFCIFFLHSQTYDNYSIKAEYLQGIIMKHNKHLENLVKGPSQGVSLSVEAQTAGEKPWHQYLNFPRIGASFTYIALSNPESLGNIFALYPYMQIPIIRTDFFSINMRPGAGLSYITKYYGNAPHLEGTLNGANGEANAANAAIGSALNVFLAFGGNLEVPITQGFSLTADYAWNHVSNGSVVQPNSGINMMNAYVGLKYSPNYKNYQKPMRKDVGDISRDFSFEITASGGVRQLYYRDGKNYGIASLGLGVYRPMANFYRMGLGADVFYDGVFGAVNIGNNVDTHYKRTYIESDELKNKLRAGISWQHEFIVGRLIAGFHFGLYLYDPIKNLEPYDKKGEEQKSLIYKYDIDKEDGWLYTRAVAKYMLSDHFFASIGLKTHLQKAEFIEWGLGYRF